jgi:hypothetical protein
MTYQGPEDQSAPLLYRLERGFSIQTLIDQLEDTHRRRCQCTGTTYEHMRDDMIVHIYHAWCNGRLEAS